LEETQLKEQDLYTLQVRMEEVYASDTEICALIEQITEDEKLCREVDEGLTFEEIQSRYQQSIHHRSVFIKNIDDR
jgi:hypothetical protein